jgi:colicin import membrane protein
MEIAIFKEITTEGVIASIEENSKKYHDGLYADMDNLPERSMVKKGAAEIGDIIKLLKASGIAITKANTAAVNKERDAIVARLELANKPFTDLLDAYNVKRKIVLDAEKARKQAIIDLDLFNRDHEMALITDENEMLRRANDVRAQSEAIKQASIDREEYAAKQVMIEIERQKARLENEKQENANAENARLANVEHVRSYNRAIFSSFIQAGLERDAAKTATQALIDNKIQNVTINY